MRDTNGDLWVAKRVHNPQHRRVLINELLANRIAAAMGLSVPDVGILLYEGFIEEPPLLGIRYVGGLFPGLVEDWNGDARHIRNVNEILGISLLDAWLCNRDRRQAVVTRKYRTTACHLYWIDFGFAFGGIDWNLDCAAHFREFPQMRDPCGSEKIAHSDWLKRLQHISLNTVLAVGVDLPEMWIDNDKSSLIALLDRVGERREKMINSLHNAYST